MTIGNIDVIFTVIFTGRVVAMYIPTNQYFAIAQRSLDACALRHKVLANNIANIDTPNFKRSGVTFESHLAIALQPKKPGKLDARKTNPLHFDFEDRKKIIPIDVKPYIVREMETDYRNDNNNVDPDFEATELAKNTMQYTTIAQILRNKFREISDVINRAGGGAR
ncbi:MAG: flagellar basal body rod protein FlgB [Candidatus Hydrogenedentota bacterium]